MPPTETKFRLSRIVASAVVFISVLCVPSEAETRRCYWCGPLAEQVHRSQRAPPCSAPHTQVTDCDPGFPYCAVVATAPPYIESRYCVKLYQDECYSLYCNSTRTWRMSCPCRGDLCNGPNTERELDAFAGLAKLVARTQYTRNRRALITKTGFISKNTNRKNRIDNAAVEENKNILNNSTDNNEGNQAAVKDYEIQMNDVNTTVDADVKDIVSQSDTTAASERKLDALAGLAKLVARTQHTRNRRALITKTGFISMNTNRKNRIDNATVEENKNILNNLSNNNEGNEAADKDNEIQINDVNTTVDADDKDMVSQSDTTAASAPTDIKSDGTQMIETTTPAVVADVELKNSEATTNSPSDITEEVMKTSDSHMNETSIQIDIPSVNIESSDLKTEIILMSSETIKVLNDANLPEISSPNINITDVPTTQEIITQTTIVSKVRAETTTEAIKTAPTEVKINENKIKSSEQLPTVGAPVTVGAQHDITVAKSTPTVRATTTSKPQNNTAVRFCSHIVTRFTLAIGLILNYV